MGRTATAFWRSSQPQSHMGIRAPHRPLWGSQAVPVSKRTLGDKGGSRGGPCSGRQLGELQCSLPVPDLRPLQAAVV